MKHSRILLISLALLAVLQAGSASAAAGVLTIPAGTKVIETRAFYGLNQVTQVVLPDGITDIGDEAFGGSVNLEEVEVSRAFWDARTAEELLALETRIFRAVRLHIWFRGRSWSRQIRPCSATVRAAAMR